MIGCPILGLSIYTLTNEVGVSLVNLLNTEWTVQLEGDDIHIKAFADATAVFCVVAIFVMIFSIVGCIGITHYDCTNRNNKHDYIQSQICFKDVFTFFANSNTSNNTKYYSKNGHHTKNSCSIGKGFDVNIIPF